MLFPEYPLTSQTSKCQCLIIFADIIVEQEFVIVHLRTIVLYRAVQKRIPTVVQNVILFQFISTSKRICFNSR